MASEIRVDKINSLSGVGTVTLSPTGVDIAGITTAATLRATTGIVTSLTAGSLTSLGAVSGTTGTFSGAVSGTTGTFSGAVSGTTGTFSAAVSGTTGTFSAAVSGTTGTFTDDVTVTGDKLKVLNASAPQVRINSDTSDGSSTRITIGQATASNNFVNGSASGDSVITFGANLLFGVGTSEKVRIDSSGRLMLGTTDATIANSGADDFVISRAGHAGITIDATSSTNSSVFFADGPTGTEAYRGFVQYSHSSDTLKLGASGADQVEISAGNVEITDGDLVIGTAGHGISFGITGNTSATGASTSNELLDDYEEGTWTPVIKNDGQTPNWTSINGKYTKIGNQVTCWFNVDGGSTPRSGGAGTSLIMTGMPFTISMFGNPIQGIIGANDEASNGLYSTTGLILNIFGQGGSQVRFGCGGQPINKSISYAAGCFTYTAAT